MNKLLLTTVSVLGIMASSAFAADPIAPEPVANWTALHIGVGGGAGYNTYDAYSLFDVGEWDSFIPDFIDIGVAWIVPDRNASDGLGAGED